MLRNRLILLALILGAGTFCSFYGGISYLLLFTALILPLASLAYLVYVLVSFRVVQKVDENILRKGDETTFRFSITNELLITYSDIEPFFQKGLVETENTETKRYTILPGESVKEEERIRFLYRGNYNVGVPDIAVFAEIDQDKMKYPLGLNITMVTTAKNDADAYELLKMLELPFAE